MWVITGPAHRARSACPKSAMPGVALASAGATCVANTFRIVSALSARVV